MIVKITIDGKEYEVSENDTILNTCRKLNITIPNLCYLRGFSPTGACGLCVVEIENIGVTLACRTNVTNGMNILTDSPKVRSIRKLNIERLLKKHNINCFNCLKNGTCKFQECAFKICGGKFEDFESNIKPLSQIHKLVSDLYYDESKCINCMKCIKFLNKICNSSLKSPKDLLNLKSIKTDVILNISDICPTAALFPIAKIPDFICEKIETYDINDVFTPRIEVLNYDNKVIKVNSVDTYIKDKNRIELTHLPNRDPTNYEQEIDNITKRILADSHELNMFVIGDNIDLISFSYLKILSEKFNNIKLCFNDFCVPKDCFLGVKRADLISMDFVFFLENPSDIEKLRFGFYQNKFRDTLNLKIEDDINDISNEKLSKIKNPYLIVYSNIFRKYAPRFIMGKIKDFEKDYFNKFGININTRIIPQNLSQMFISKTNSYISITDLFSKFNKHDILSFCIIGDIDYDLKISEETYAISNSVFEYPGCIHIPSKHYIEDEGYYINAFGELLKTKQVINNDLKSNREFLFDLMKSIFSDNFDSINNEVKIYIRNNFFENYDAKYL